MIVLVTQVLSLNKLSEHVKCLGVDQQLQVLVVDEKRLQDREQNSELALVLLFGVVVFCSSHVVEALLNVVAAEQNCVTLVLQFHILIFVPSLDHNIFKGEDRLRDILGRNEFRVSREPLKSFHLPHDRSVRLVHESFSVHRMLVNEFLEEGPQLIGLFDQSVHSSC